MYYCIPRHRLPVCGPMVFSGHIASLIARGTSRRIALLKQMCPISLRGKFGNP